MGRLVALYVVGPLGPFLALEVGRVVMSSIGMYGGIGVRHLSWLSAAVPEVDVRICYCGGEDWMLK